MKEDIIEDKKKLLIKDTNFGLVSFCNHRVPGLEIADIGHTK